MRQDDSKQIERLVEWMLRDQLGAHVERIAEAETRRADYRASFEREAFLVEVKARFDDDKLEHDLRGGEIVEREPEMEYARSICADLRDGVAQLTATPGREDCFALVWLVAAGVCRQIQRDQVRATLYGAADVYDLDRQDGDLVCYFLNRAEFARYPNLDGVVSVDPHAFGRWKPGARLYPNPFGPRLRELEQTRLYHRFLDRDAVCSPEREELEGRALIADKTDRELAGESKLRYLQRKYGRPSITRLNAHGWFGVVSTPPLE